MTDHKRHAVLSILDNPAEKTDMTTKAKQSNDPQVQRFIEELRKESRAAFWQVMAATDKYHYWEKATSQ